jgi:hypothetical protein
MFQLLHVFRRRNTIELESHSFEKNQMSYIGGGWAGRVQYMGGVTDIVTVVAAKAIKSVKSGIASKI